MDDNYKIIERFDKNKKNVKEELNDLFERYITKKIEEKMLEY